MLTRYPFNRDFDLLERALFGAAPKTPTVFRPAVDIREDDDAFVVLADVPGVPKDAIDIDVSEGTLTIRGEHSEEKITEPEAEGEEGKVQGTYRMVERRRGSFMRAFQLPENVDVDAIEAKLEDGVLQLRLPKREKAGTRKISVTKH